MVFGRVDRLGVGAGMRGREVGVGGASVPWGPAERVGPTGAVVATDIDVSWTRDVADRAAVDRPPPVRCAWALSYCVVGPQ